MTVKRTTYEITLDKNMGATWQRTRNTASRNGRPIQRQASTIQHNEDATIVHPNVLMAYTLANPAGVTGIHS